MKSIKELEKQFKGISTGFLVDQIEILDENIRTIKSAGTTIIDLKVYVRVRTFRDELITLVRKRNGQMPFETEESPD
jgi:hypothetical protein